LIDEVDSFLRENEDARGILNSGFTRASAYIVRCVGDNHEATRFSTWSPKSLCGIGKLSATLADRSIPLRLRRKSAGETVANYMHIPQAETEPLRSRIARWADDNRESIRQSRPPLIASLHDRAQDCWEPLQAIAIAAGGDWPAHARAAALALHGAEDDVPSIGAELLQDIKAIFDERDVKRIGSVELLIALNDDSEAPWVTWSRGRPMTGRQLAKKLEDFGIRAATMRYAGERFRGYERRDFDDAFSRYLSPFPVPP
jgi:hypothetical protein